MVNFLIIVLFFVIFNTVAIDALTVCINLTSYILTFIGGVLTAFLTCISTLVGKMNKDGNGATVGTNFFTSG